MKLDCTETIVSYLCQNSLPSSVAQYIEPFYFYFTEENITKHTTDHAFELQNGDTLVCQSHGQVTIACKRTSNVKHQVQVGGPVLHAVQLANNTILVFSRRQMQPNDEHFLIVYDSQLSHPLASRILFYIPHHERVVSHVLPYRNGVVLLFDTRAYCFVDEALQSESIFDSSISIMRAQPLKTSAAYGNKLYVVTQDDVKVYIDLQLIYQTSNMTSNSYCFHRGTMYKYNVFTNAPCKVWQWTTEGFTLIATLPRDLHFVKLVVFPRNVIGLVMDQLQDVTSVHLYQKETNSTRLLCYFYNVHIRRLTDHGTLLCSETTLKEKCWLMEHTDDESLYSESDEGDVIDGVGWFSDEGDEDLD